MRCVVGPAPRQSARQVGVGQEQSTVGDEVGGAVCDELQFALPGGLRSGVWVEHERSSVSSAQRVRQGTVADFDDVQVGQGHRAKALHKREVRGRGIGFPHVVKGIAWGDPQRGAVCADRIGDAANHLDGELDSIRNRTTPLVAAEIRCSREELVHQVAIGAVHFHAVEPGVYGIAGGLGEVVHGGGDLGAAQFARREQRVHAMRGEHRSVRGDRARSDRHQPVG